MSDQHQAEDDSVVREFHREERRLARLRLVAEQPSSEQTDFSDDYEPDPQEAA
jgi:hypothetical protein